MSSGVFPPPSPPAPAPANAPQGRVIGRYEVLQEIAPGGMATVYLGRTRGAAGFERMVAIKVCHPHLRHDDEFAAMFLDEARLAARIHHPNVVSTLDVGEGEELYLVMEYIEGDRLSTLIKSANKKGEKVPLGIVARIFIDALSGLHAAHELRDAQGLPLDIVHRDVSPQNILVGVDGVTRITDFGIAKAAAQSTVTREGQVKGKLSYIAPEQVQGGPVTRAVDVYAAGVVLWEALTGRRLFRADSDAETFNLVLQGKVPKPSILVPGVPPELDAIVERAVDRDPARRFASASEFADALEAAPFKVASTRQVGAYVTSIVGDAMAARREFIRKVDEGLIPPMTEHSSVRPSGARGGPFVASGSMSGEHVAPVVPNLAPAPVPALGEPSRDRRPVWFAVAAVAVLLLIGAALTFRQGAATTPPEARRAVAPPAPSVAVAPPPMQPPVAPPAVDPVPAPSVQVIAPSVAAAAPDEAPVLRRRGGLPTLRRGNPPVAAAPSVAAPPSLPAAPSTAPPGEFRPGSI